MRTYQARTEHADAVTIRVPDIHGRREAAETFACQLPSALRVEVRAEHCKATELVVVTDADGIETRWLVEIGLELRVRARPALDVEDES